MGMAVATALLVSRAFPRAARSVELAPEHPTHLNWPLRYALVAAYFLAIVLFCAWLQGLGMPAAG
jgi:hypothetical protein